LGQRIQKALDACPKGQAVELKAEGGHNAFLSGPLELREGVMLEVAAGTILFGSRAARLYDLRPGSCGIVDQAGHGCEPLIGGNAVAHSGVAKVWADQANWPAVMRQKAEPFTNRKVWEFMGRAMKCAR